MYLLIPKGGISLVTCVGDLEASKTLLGGLQSSISNFLQDWKKIWDRSQTYLMGEKPWIKGYVSNWLREKWSCIYELLISFSKQLMYKYECSLSIWTRYVMLWLERIVSRCDVIDWVFFIINVSSHVFVFAICYLSFVVFHMLFFFYAISYF